MKLVLASCMSLVVTAAALGQHGGASHAGGGGFSHSSSGSFSGRSYAAPSVGAPTYRPGQPAPRPTNQYRSSGSPAPFGATFPARGGNNNRRPYHGGGYRPYYSSGVYLVPGWLNYGPGDNYYSSDAGDSSSNDPPAASVDGYAQGPTTGSDPAYGQGPAYEQGQGYGQEYGQMPARRAYQPEAPASASAGEPPAVTLLFKDGRAPQQVQNYALTTTTLYILDGGRRREVPLEQLDLPLTEKTNREAGIDFEVPVS